MQQRQLPKKKEKPNNAAGSKELEKAVRRLEREIDAMERRIADLDTQLAAAATDYQELLRLTEERQTAEASLEELMSQWEEAAAALET